MIAQENAAKIAFFLDICQDRHLAANTVKSYDYALEAYYNYLLDKDLAVENVKLYEIREFKKTKLADYAPTSQNLKLSVIRKFYDTLMEFRIVDYNPVSLTFNNKLPQKTLSYVPDDQYPLIDGYIAQCSSDNYLLGLRIMYFCGLRIGEVSDIDLINDVFFQKNKMYLRVHGKGAKERIVPVFSDRVVNQINSMRYNHKSLIPLKLGVSPQGYDYHFGNIAQKYNIPVYSCHDFRRGFAVNLYSSTRDLEMLRVLLGHESYNTTLIYIRDATINVYNLPDALYTA